MIDVKEFLLIWIDVNFRYDFNASNGLLLINIDLIRIQSRPTVLDKTKSTVTFNQF